MKKYFIKTYGCQMNVADSAKLAEVMNNAGYSEFKTDDDSADIRKLADVDLVLVNTCVVRQNAEDRAGWYLASLKGLKELNPNVKIGLCGCYVTEPGREVRKQFPHVDLFIPPNQPELLKNFLSRVTSLESRVNVPRPATRDPELVTIMHGCDNYCSYCVVPYVRGREVSRPMDEVLAEIKGLIGQGVTDITLLGQNVNSYKYGLDELLRSIPNNLSTQPPNNLIIRFLTCHPRDMSDEIIEAVHELPYVAKEFMVPLQSGDDEVLKRMNRGYTFEHFLGRVRKIRSLMPDARISSDIIVGFPGETEEQFQNTLRAVEQIEFREVHMFAYSDRPNTAASKMDNKLSEEVKQERLQRLINAVRGIVKNKR